MKTIILIIIISVIGFNSCSKNTENKAFTNIQTSDSSKVEDKEPKKVKPEDIKIVKNFLYDKYTLEDSYPYKDTTRSFQWDKIRVNLAMLDSIEQTPTRWAILRNYRNGNGEAPLVKEYKRDAYKRIADTFGVERYQGIPLFLPADTLTGERYGNDGALVKYIEDEGSFSKIETVAFDGKWLVPQKYIKRIEDTVVFHKAIFVDLTNQNIVTMEKTDTAWVVRSMNPATSGLHRPPHQQETPLGIFVIQERKNKMFFLVDGTQRTGGFAPYASRFTNGGYIHGIPVNAPRKNLIEYSSSLGTTPRSHMCVRNATSHAKFVFDWAVLEETLVFVIK